MANNLPALFASNAALPAYLKGAAADTANALAAHHTESFPVLSIKGKTWTVVKGGERNIIMNPKDPDSPATYIEAVIVKASPVKNKVWYAGSYVEGAEPGKPDCYSVDGEKPAADAEKPQAKSCAACPKNQWGSKVSTDGTNSKGKACSDTIRLAVAPVSALNDPMLLRIPPASIKAAGEYGKLLAKRGVPLGAVITKLKFNPDAPTPQVMFDPVGFLSEAQFAEVSETAESDTVKAILDAAPVETEAPAPSVLDEVPEHLKAAAEPKAEKKAAAAPAPTPTPEPVKAVEKTPEELEAEEEERQLAELMAKQALRKAKQVSPEPTVTVSEVQAAVEAGEAGAAVPTKATRAKKTTPQETAENTPAAIEVDGIPDLSAINFDD